MRSRVASLLLLAAAVVAGTALAQPRKHGKKPPAAAPAAPEASAREEARTESRAEEGVAVLDAGASRGAVPMPPGYGSDAGLRPSPLNPAPDEMPSRSAADAGAASTDYDRLLGDIAALRARAAAVGDALFHARMAVGVETNGSHAQIVRLTVSVDDGVVYSAPAGFHADDPVTVYDHAVAPGRHAVTIDVERKDDRGDAFRSAQRSRFIVEVPKDEKLDVALRIDDDSSMGGDFPSDRSGKYDLRVRMKAQARSIAR